MGCGPQGTAGACRRSGRSAAMETMVSWVIMSRLPGVRWLWLEDSMGRGKRQGAPAGIVHQGGESVKVGAHGTAGHPRLILETFLDHTNAPRSACDALPQDQHVQVVVEAGLLRRGRQSARRQ
jgi:hypothetical protein